MDATDTARALLNDTDGAVRASAATTLARLAIMATSGAALAALTASSEAAAKQGKRVVGPSPTVQKLIAAAEDKCIIAPFRRACVEAVGHAANAAATAVEMYLATQDVVDAAIRVVSSIDSIAFGDRPMQRASSMDAVSGSSGGNITRWLGRAVRSGTTSGGSSSPRAGGTGALALDTTIDAGVAAAATTRVVRAVNAGVLVRGDDATRRALLGALTKRLLATAEATTCTTSAADAAALLLCIDAIDLLTELTQAHASALDTALEKTCRGCQSNVWFCCGGDRQGIRSTCRGGSETCSWHAKLSNRWHGVLVFAACGTCMPGDSPARRAATANPWDACAHSEPFCDICCVAHRQGR